MTLLLGDFNLTLNNNDSNIPRNSQADIRNRNLLKDLLNDYL